MATFTGVRFDLLHQAPGAGFDINLGIFTAHVGFHPARMHGEHSGIVVTQLMMHKGVGHGVERRLTGFVERQFRCVRYSNAAQHRTHECQHAAVFTDFADKLFRQINRRHAVGIKQLTHLSQRRVT